MAATDLRAATKTGWVHVEASIGTTWRQIQLPPWCNQVTVNGSAAIYLAGDSNGTTASPEAPADAGVVGTHKMAIAANSPYPLGVCGDPLEGAVGGGATPTTSIFVAAQSGTATITVQLERV